MGDIVTGFLFRQFAASFASTLSFGFYFVFSIWSLFAHKTFFYKA